MNLVAAALYFVFALFLILAGISRVGAFVIERRNPPVGQFATVNGTRLHYVNVPAGAAADLPPVVFIHGASGNLLDQMIPLRPLLEGRADLVFLDRPGHGWSARGPDNETPFSQADTIAALMDHLGIGKAIIVGHSLGGSVAAAFALRHPERTRGLVFVAAATHPWEGAGTAWYYRLTATPVLGWLFAETIAFPAGSLSMERASTCVFSPNPLPSAYLHDAAISLVLRPSAFRANAIDVEGLLRNVTEAAKRYGEIRAPTVVISGDSDTVVYEEIHSLGLIRDIPGAEIVWIKNLGHKPDWVAPDLVAAAIAKVGGKQVDLQALAGRVTSRIAADSSGKSICVDEKPARTAPLQPTAPTATPTSAPR